VEKQKKERCRMKYVEPAREIPVVASGVDVLVVGAGPAGIAASIAAARTAKEVLLVEGFGVLGGTSTASLVTTLPYRFLLLEDGKNKIYEGVFKEFVDNLVKSEGISMSPAETRVWNMYHPDIHGTMMPADPEIMKYIYSKLVRESGVKVMLHTHTVNVIKEGDALKGIIVENISGRQAIMAERIVDATGNGDVAARAGAPFHLGDGNDPAKTLPWSLIFYIGNVDVDRLSEYMAIYDPDLRKIIDRGIEEGELSLESNADSSGFLGKASRIRVRVYHSKCRPREVIVHGAHAVHLNATSAEDVTKGELSCRDQMINLYKYLKKTVPGFEKSYITASGFKVGIRESRRIDGEYLLKKEEAEKGKDFDDAVVRTTLSLYETRGVVYSIPYGCLIPKKIENLIVAGRCISVEPELMDSIREIPVCMATGQAAGVAAALSAAARVSFRGLDLKSLQERLIGQGVNLGPRWQL
jgi:hypothetical protein